MSVPHTRPGVWPRIPSGRFAAGITRSEVSRSDPAPGGSPGDGARGWSIALLGLPDDNGIVLNQGRPGATSGPTAFRAALAGYGTGFDRVRAAPLDAGVYDAGDVVPAPGGGEAALLETHARVTAAARALHERGYVVACVGGGHDLTLPSVRALAEASGDALGGINVDAHLDVREEIGSGMAFRRLIEEASVDPRRFVTFGAGRFVHRPEHVRWLGEVGGTVFGVDDVREDARTEERAFSLALEAPTAFVSIDLDVLDGAHAPGVSAVNPAGLAVATVARVAERAGREAGVRHFDLMELSPPHDPDGRTARVAALLFLHFVAGVSVRDPR